MTYAIEILRPAQKQLARLDRRDQDRVLVAIRGLAAEPRPHGCKKLSGREAWRIRVGSIRVIYEIHDNHLRILVVVIGHRGEVYR